MALLASLLLALAGGSLVLSLPQHKLHFGMSDYHLEHFFNVKSFDAAHDVEYDLATPWQTEDDGSYLSHHLGEEGRAKSRRRRSAGEDIMKDMNFKLHAFGEEHHFRLKRNDEFLNPNKVLVVVRDGEKSSSMFVDKRCYYHGDLKSHDDSEVALSNCNNELTGYVRKRREVYHIHPLPNYLKMHDHNPDGHSHLIVVDKKRGLPQAAEDIIRNYDHRQRRQAASSTTTEPPPANTFSPEFKTCTEETLPPGDDNTTDTASLFDTMFLNSFGSTSRIFQRNYVQAAAFLDYTMVRKHGQQVDFLTDYTLSMFNMISLIYQPQKTLYPVTVVLNRIEILTSQPAGLYITQDSKFLLENFCGWQQGQWQSVPETWRWNHAFLITGYGLCFGRNTDCGELGRAPIEGVCVPDRQCSVNREGGLNTAFVLAHELGHNVGMFHDGHPTKSATCPYREGYLMAPSTGDARRIWDFSLCSRSHLRYYLSRQESACMALGPAGPTIDQSLLDRTSCRLPGQQYDANYQCRLQFMHLEKQYYRGHQFKFCSRTTYGRNNICFHLYCDDGNPRRGCFSTYTPAMDGTRCGVGKICYRFRCVDERTVKSDYCAPHPKGRVFVSPPSIDRTQAPATAQATVRPTTAVIRTPSGPINGGWTPFSAYSHCEGPPCGFGVRFRTRSCTNPLPRNGGRQCEGQERVYELCMLNACPGDKSYREYICNKHGFLQPFIPSVSTPADRQCKLECLGRSGQPEVLREKAHNGVSCATGYCFQGKCSIGCDGIVGSNKVVDNCGVCGGDNSKCRQFSGRLTPTWTAPGMKTLRLRSTGNAILTGSWKISIRETSYSPNSLFLLRDSNRFGPVSYYVNGGGNLTTGFYDFEVAGTRGQYTNRVNVPESLVINGAINRPLIVEVNFTGGQVPSYDFSFISPILEPAEKFFWKLIADWSTCTATCGTGVSVRRYHCINTLTQNTASYQLCVRAGKPEPAYVRVCMRRPCSVVRTGASISAVSPCKGCLRLVQRNCIGYHSDTTTTVLAPRFCPDISLNYLERCVVANMTNETCSSLPMATQVAAVCQSVSPSACAVHSDIRAILCPQHCNRTLAAPGVCESAVTRSACEGNKDIRTEFCPTHCTNLLSGSGASQLSAQLHLLLGSLSLLVFFLLIG